ncbi:MAG: hypothetical protein IJ629_05345 [Clostridia bacterium]|nr:hypothetical protein [Clostridia bacterium]
MDEENKKTTPASDEENKTEVKEVQEVTPKAEEKPEEKAVVSEAKVEPQPVQTSKTEVKKDKPKKKKKVGFIVSVIFILLAVIAGAVLGAVYAIYFAKTEIDLAKYVSIEFEGYEGYASFDEDDLVIDVKGLKKALDDKKLANKLSERLMDKATVKENEELKNGDVIEVKFKVSESWLKENKIKLTSDTVKLTVKDLEETNAIDLFEDLEFSYSGISPDLTVSLKNNSTDDFIKKVNYTMETSSSSPTSYSLYDVANGDKITVTATYSQSDLESAGYTVANDEYTFTVEGQAEYIADSDDFTNDIKTKVEAKLLEKAKNIANNSNYDVTYAYHEDFSDVSHYDYNFTHTDPTLEKMYIAINKDMNDIGWYDSRNIVFAIYKSTFTDTTTSKTYDFFIPVYVDDLVADSEGLYTGKTYYYDEYYSYNYESESYKTSDGVYKLFDENTKDDYTVTEVK